MAAAAPSVASRMISHTALVDRLRQNASGVLIRTDIAFCCDQMRALCAPDKLLPSSNVYPSCLYYSGHDSLDGRCVLNTPIKTSRDPRDRKKFQVNAMVHFETVAHYFESLLPIRDSLLLLEENKRKQQFAELRHCIYTAIALDAIKVRGKVCRSKY